MIEKLKRPVKIGGTTFREKINELVDAVNKLQEHEEKHLDLLTQLNEMRLQKKEPADPYAEQKKWIGKVCRFWDFDDKDCIFGILTDIDKESILFKYCCNEITNCKHCEPVRPDDDIIYKKEQQCL